MLQKLFVRLTKWRILILLALSLFTLATILLSYSQTHPTTTMTNWPKYTVVIDAGSSGSRVMVYRRNDVTQPSNSSLPRIEPAGQNWTLKTTPGISSFDTQDGITSHLAPLLDFATSVVPQEEISQTPIYLLATGGMRLLPQTRQSWVLARAWTFAHTWGFLVPQTGFQVVSGELEGLLGWLAINYLMDTFDSPRGFLDMGGASTQIVFEPPHKSGSLAKVTLRTLGGTEHEHHVFVRSFLGHGINEARRRYTEMLHNTTDPCLAHGIHSTGSFSHCMEMTAPLLSQELSLPEIDFAQQRFVGISEYWYTLHDHLGPKWDLEALERAASGFCQHPAEASLCFKAAWLANVLRGFNVPLKAEFESVFSVGSTEVSWTLGKVLLNAMESIGPRPLEIELPNEPTQWSPTLCIRLLARWARVPWPAKLALLLTVLWAVGFAATVFCIRRHRKMQRVPRKDESVGIEAGPQPPMYLVSDVYRARVAAPISRSSSVNNLLLANRRRGGD
ncbi:Golgi apyrase [Coemansia spiralis]|uniref:Golgi apyrase n=2 Tax=Coemansia TaxID=4863 RepID=A0A9W8G4A9_9FUNG|nr:nucleoside phosphatase family-domain-containing protein [Coemansia spiralis]KAJ1989930.1 Golgi apyrase [Coemansia umbellata]KAJ2620644.1 Golgi apyrase [Coemansia sp. RSA 1358]KAJ2673819.1 Golgi apyrase [Coemansia spiralis]